MALARPQDTPTGYYKALLYDLSRFVMIEGSAEQIVTSQRRLQIWMHSLNRSMNEMFFNLELELYTVCNRSLRE